MVMKKWLLVINPFKNNECHSIEKLKLIHTMLIIQIERG